MRASRAVTAKAKRSNWLELGSSAIDAGDLATAEQCFTEAVKADKRNPRCHFYLAIVLEALEKFGPAAEHLTMALRLDPNDADAARRLSSLACRHSLFPDVVLDPAGLRAALRHDSSSSWIIAKLALHYLTAKGPLAPVYELARREGWTQAATAVCVTRTGEALKDELWLAILQSSILRDADAEQLLTALRRALLLETAPERFLDRGLLAFAIAMLHQCRMNEYIWSTTDAEEARLASFDPSASAWQAGDVQEGCRLLQVLLYKGMGAVLSQRAPEAFDKVRPKALREALQLAALEDRSLRVRAQSITKLGPITNAVSRKAALQYERSPYPRWTSLRKPSTGEERKLLGNFFTPDRLTFMDRPYNILVAGSGTGHQAVYGALSSPNARVTAVDLSSAALAYGAMMADRYAAPNIEFLQADILDLAGVPRCKTHFQVIECVGVLHHMEDPFEGWRRLLDCLAPQGKMLIGLYSAAARRVITELREDPAFPGADCDDRALREFRQDLIGRSPGQLGGELKLGPDFYSASEFRDLTCHVNERCVTLAAIDRFLKDNALTFRGFWIDIRELDAFHRAYPSEPWPGRLGAWEAHEAAQPHTFAAMYTFWCDRA
jgi:SAM-dependent methyltransferase/tetratricopeptide (TPR) repeat protein